jgi:LacI family repressor for deo operon, udp, cdd, tsx, nupC, and nupG
LHGGLYVEGGQKLAAEFLKLRQKPTGICVTNETVAAKFIIEVQRAGMQVPGDLSVVSHDDTPMAQCCAVPLTTISHPVEAIAGTVVEMLCSRLDGSYSGEPRTSILRGELVQRQSAASLKH